jgi:hypothetical protein
MLAPCDWREGILLNLIEYLYHTIMLLFNLFNFEIMVNTLYLYIYIYIIIQLIKMKGQDSYCTNSVVGDNVLEMQKN